MNETLQALLRDSRICRGGVAMTPAAGIPTGCSELDAALPGGGWPRAALAEILIERHGLGELALLMPALARLSRGEERMIVWVAPPFLPYAPALVAAGIDLARLWVVRASGAADALWSAEQALRSGSCAAVLLWAEPATGWLRRLQLGAEAGAALGVLFRTSAAHSHSSYAALRLRMWPERLELLKCRGGRPRVLDAPQRAP
jgi:protein ImuA